MDDVELRNQIFAGAFYTVMIGVVVWQILRLLSRGSLDGAGAIRLASSVFVLGILCYVGYTMLSIWT